jgi:hypothetical protein
MTYRAVFSSLSFQQTKTDDPTVPVGDPVLVAKGEALPDWVSPFQVNALVNAGMIVNTGDERPAYLAPEAELPAQPRTPDQPDVLPSDPNGTPLTMADLDSSSRTAEKSSSAAAKRRSTPASE